MSEPEAGSSGEDSPGGLQAIQKSAIRYLEARLRLFQYDAAEAATQGLGLLALAVLAVSFGLIGWLLVAAALVACLAQWLDWRWEFVALALGAVHFLAGLLFVGIFLSKKRTHLLFRGTSADPSSS